MTGAAFINSPHAFQSIRNLFVDKYLTPEYSKLPSHNVKLAWQSTAVCRAALEISHGDKMSGKEIHVKMWEKYVRWAKIICEEDDANMKIDTKPGYLSEQFFMTSDAKHKKFYAVGETTGQKFWKKWGAVKSAIINSDNHVVKRTIASMPGGALPSGTDWSLFLTRLIYNLYMEKEKIKPKKVTHDDDDGDVIDEIGGSAAKKVGPSPYTEDPLEENDCEDDTGSQNSNVTNTVKGGNTCSNDDNDKSVKGGDNDHDHDDEHDEPTAPHTFFPSTLLIILNMGVLSDDCDKLLNHAIDRGEVEESNKATVPSRAECRASALIDVPHVASLSSAISSPPTSIERLREKAAYNEAYKQASQQKNELGVKRLKLAEEELDIKRIEVKARQDEVKARQDEVKARQDEVKIQGLERYYADLRQDLNDAKDSNDAEEIKIIKEEMRMVQKERRELSLR